MSLRIWLPLNNSIINQGLSNYTITQLGNISWVDGKLGSKSLKIGDGTQVTNGLQINSNLIDLLNGDYSIAIWVKPYGNHVHYNGSILSSGNWNTANKRWAFGLSQDNSKVDILSMNYNQWITCAVPVNKWTHLCCTRQGNIVKLYKNGEYVGQSDRSSDPVFNSDYSTTCIGRETYAGGYFSFNGALQDLRLYDHCLSVKEVKDISKGLILHYPLNSFTAPQINLVTGALAGGQTTVSNGVVTINGTNKDTYFRLQLSEALTVGQSYVISCIANGIDEDKQWCFPIGGQNNSSWKWIIKEGYNEYSFIAADGFVPNPLMFDDTSPSTMRGTDKPCTLSNFKLYKVNNAIIKDCSGYNNDGEIYSYDADGTLITEINAPRYDKYIHINSANNTTNTASGTKYIYGHCALTNPTAMTVAFWCKPVAGYGGGTTQGQFCTTTYAIGTNAGSDYQGSAMNHRDGTINVNDSASTTQIQPAIGFTANEWHHYAVTYDGQVARTYRDGVELSNKTFSAETALDSFIGVIIGFSKAGGVWRSNNSSYSDFRVYATCLSAIDVKELYEVSASVDNLGNVHAFGIQELGDNLMWLPNFSLSRRVWGDGTGLGAYTQANCQVTLTNANGYRIYRTPNVIEKNVSGASDNTHNMYGGLRVTNSTLRAAHVYDATKDNIFGLEQGHTYLWSVRVKGITSQAPTMEIVNNAGWGGGGLSPTPSGVTVYNLPSDFEGERECFYKFTINDTVTKTCTTAYSSFVKDNIYLSYKDFMWRWNYGNTGTNGTDIQVLGIHLYDITNVSINVINNIMKNGLINFTTYIEGESKTSINIGEEILGQEFIEK